MTLLVAFVVVASGVGAAAGVTSAAASVGVTISAVDASPDDPTPGETFTVTPTVSNLQSNDGAAAVRAVYVQERGSADDLAVVGNKFTDGSLGSIDPGDSMSVPVSLSLNETGDRELMVYALVEGPDGDVDTISYPVTVTVGQPDEVQLGVSTTDAVAGEETSVNVTVANGDDESVSGVEVELSGDADVENAERVSGSLESGAERTHTYDVTFAEGGTQTLEAEAKYTTADGDTQRVTKSVDVAVDEAVVDTGLSVSVDADDNGSAFEVELANFGNAALTDVELLAQADGETFERSLAPDVGADEATTVSLDADDAPEGEVTVVARYTAAGESRETSTTVSFTPASTGEIRLTGVETAQSGNTLTIQGDAANLGGTDASSVLLSVRDAAGVTPVSPSKEYFVGSVDTSEFATFELTAQVDAGVETVPVEVEYTVDGERKSEAVRLDVSAANGSAAASGGQAAEGQAPDGGPPSGAGGPQGGPGGVFASFAGINWGLMAAALVGVVAVPSLGYYLWKRR